MAVPNWEPARPRVGPSPGPRVVGLAVAFAAIVCLSSLAVAPASALAFSSGLQTNYRSNGVSPPTASYSATAYDAADGYVLLYGGLDANGNPTPYTWVFTQGNWTNLTGILGASPPAMYGAGAAYDPALGEVVLFGGCLNAACTADSGATWGYAHDRWTNLTAQVGPAPAARGRLMMVYDASMSEVLLFGGESGGTGPTGVLLDDTWLFNGTWNQFTNASSPTPRARSGAGIAYDASSQGVVLFGGNVASSRIADTWVFANGAWSNRTPSAGAAPSARWGAAMAYDSEDGYVLLVNGCDNGNSFGDTWTFSGTSWADLSPAHAPPATCGSALVDDPGDGYVLFFSGDANGGQLTSTYIFVHGGWNLLINPPGSLLPLYAVLVPLFVLLLLIPLFLWVGRRSRRKRAAALAEGFPLRPGDGVTWLETPPAIARSAVRRALPLAIMLVVLLPVLFLAGSAVSLLVGILFTALFGGLMAAVILSVPDMTPKSIGVAQAGVIARMKSGEIRAPWSQLQPGANPPFRGVVWFQVYLPGNRRGLTGFSTSQDQARAIIQSPYAPPWILSPLLATALGLPAQRVAPVSGPTTPSSNTPAPAGPLSPAPSPPNFAPSPLPPAPAGPNQPLRSSVLVPPAPPQPAGPSGPPPGMVACPRCGQLNPMSGVMFCRSCGQRLRR